MSTNREASRARRGDGTVEEFPGDRKLAISDFRVRSVIGKGGFGKVYKATFRASGKTRVYRYIVRHFICGMEDLVCVALLSRA